MRARVWLHQSAALFLGLLARQQRAFELEPAYDAISVADLLDLLAAARKLIEPSVAGMGLVDSTRPGVA